MREPLAVLRFAKGRPDEVIVLTLEFRQEEGRWLAECLELGTPAYSNTLEQAKKEVLEAVTLHLNQVEEMHIAEEFLKEHGVRRMPIKTPKGRRSNGLTWGIPASAAG